MNATNMESKEPTYRLKDMTLRIVGDTPLIVDNMRDLFKKDTSNGRDRFLNRRSNPWTQYCSCLYWFSEKPENPTDADVEAGVFGFPSGAFKSAISEAARADDPTIKRTAIRGKFFVIDDGNGLSVLKGKPTPEEYPLKILGCRPFSRIRAKFKEWSLDLKIRYNADAITMERILELANLAGTICGVGRWCPEKEGDNGRFHAEVVM